jgi:hypothetical protein
MINETFFPSPEEELQVFHRFHSTTTCCFMPLIFRQFSGSIDAIYFPVSGDCRKLSYRPKSVAYRHAMPGEKSRSIFCRCHRCTGVGVSRCSVNILPVGARYKIIQNLLFWTICSGRPIDAISTIAEAYYQYPMIGLQLQIIGSGRPTWPEYAHVFKLTTAECYFNIIGWGWHKFKNYHPSGYP